MTPQIYKQILLVILDGWGYREDPKDNAIVDANPEFMNYLWKTYPHALFAASGEAVGLPKGIIGTSEIGHTIIGAGKILNTDIVRINKAIQDNTFKNNPALQHAFGFVLKNKSTLHLLGLVSPGGVHSYQEHLYALLQAAKDKGITDIAVHVITDGRDTAPKSALEYVKQLEDFLTELGAGHIASISGRYFAMDRDNNWDRTDKEFAVLTSPTISETEISVDKAIKQSYQNDKSDEFIEPIRFKNGGHNYVQPHDAIIFFNFRPDRARQLSKKLSEMGDEYCFATMTEYDPTIKSLVLFPPEKITTTLAGEIAKAGLTQIHIAETEKYAHVTYFFNGGDEKEHQNEQFVLIDSRKDVPTHDLAPHMRAKEIADRTVQAINDGVNFIVINFANADMVGHTGKWEPTLEAIKFEDEQIKRVVEAVLEKQGVAFITADHGNAEEMKDEKTGEPKTSHTLNPVPGIITIKDAKMTQEGTLADVAPTILALFGLAKPAEMTGKDLLS